MDSEQKQRFDEIVERDTKLGGDICPDDCPSGECQAERDRRFLLTELRKVLDKLAAPCGSCHPCTEWANQTWVNAGERLPHHHEWQEMKAKLQAYEAARAKLNDWAGRARTGYYDEAQDDVVQMIKELSRG